MINASDARKLYERLMGETHLMMVWKRATECIESINDLIEYQCKHGSTQLILTDKTNTAHNKAEQLFYCKDGYGNEVRNMVMAELHKNDYRLKTVDGWYHQLVIEW